MDFSSSENGETRGSPYLWFYGVLSLYAAVFLVYAETRAFTFDEGYHLLAAQLIVAGRTPYIDFCFPQTPLNVYWNAAWMRIVGGSWRVPHLWAALFTIGAVVLTADYVLRRFPVRVWRAAGAIVAALGIGLNGAVFVYGPLQSYGISLFGLAAGFRLAVRAVDRDGWLPSAAVGFCGGVAAASSLLTAAAAPVLLVWMVFYNRAGRRWKKIAAFALGVLVPFAPVFWLFARGPRQTWFNLFRYHAYFRRLYWPDTTRHDLEILTAWIDNGQALLLGLLALAGLVYVVRQSAWPHSLKTEFYLCAWLTAALSAEVGRAHPTFARYFLLTTPFLAILAVAGLFALSRAFETDRPLWPVLVVAALFALGLSKTLYERRELDTWSNYQRVAAKIDQVTPPNAPVFALEPLYFLTRRTPPPGYELASYTHLVDLPPAEAALMHVLNEAEVKRQVQSGMFATAYTCEDDEIADYGLKTLYKQHVELEGCSIFWERAK
jgi:hypothetical protein